VTSTPESEVPNRGAAPVACTLGADDAAARWGRWQQLHHKVAPVAHCGDGVLEVCYPPEPGVVEELTALAAAEQACCSFATWTVTAVEGQPVLRVAAPAEAPEAIDPIAALFDAAGPPRSPSGPVARLGQAFAAVGALVTGIGAGQWSAPTPCTDWTVRQLVGHLVGMNRIFTALLTEQALPEGRADYLGDDPMGAYHDSAAALQAAFEAPGVLERIYHGPLGAATGADRLQIRLYDLLAHGWDLAQATGQSTTGLPAELAEQALVFVQAQLAGQDRTGRFAPAQPAAENAPALERLAAFLGRPVSVTR
jgi:uncharacterized protein (TIGR03086 family)